jgi:hypothetical protein
MSYPGPSDIQELRDSLIEKYWDDTIDGDRLNASDRESFWEPFFYTAQLQAQEIPTT